MGAKAIATIERLSGRTVSASMSTNHIDPDLALETFVLVPAHVEAAADSDGHPPGWPA